MPNELQYIFGHQRFEYLSREWWVESGSSFAAVLTVQKMLLTTHDALEWKKN